MGAVSSLSNLGATRCATARPDNRAAPRFVHRPRVPSHRFSCGCLARWTGRSTGSQRFYRQNALPWIGEDVIGEVIEWD